MSKTCEVCGRDKWEYSGPARKPDNCMAAFMWTPDRHSWPSIVAHWRLGYERQRAEVLRLTEEQERWQLRFADSDRACLRLTKERDNAREAHRLTASVLVATDGRAAIAEASAKALREALERIVAVVTSDDWLSIPDALEQADRALAPPNPSAEKLTPAADRLHACDPFEGGVGMADAALARLAEPPGRVTPDPEPLNWCVKHECPREVCGKYQHHDPAPLAGQKEGP